MNLKEGKQKSDHEQKTQAFSTWGDKLLQHTDVLYNIQNKSSIRPITIQIAPIEACDSDCPFCSVADRPISSKMSFSEIVNVLTQFKNLGAKSVEITGGGNPMLYRDTYEGKKVDINDIILYAKKLGFDVGMITNTHNPAKILTQESIEDLSWIRISLIKLDESKNPEDYELSTIPGHKLGFSYIIYDSTEKNPNPFSRTKKTYAGTTVESIRKMARLVELNPDVKFVRIAGNCLIKGNNTVVRENWKEVISELDKLEKFFIKDIGDDDGPFNDGCYVGAIRPYIAPNPNGGDYQIYTCTSHVLNCRNYDLKFSLGSIRDIEKIWNSMSLKLADKKPIYEVNNNCGRNWETTCRFCYYKFNNKLLHTVVSEMPDKNFP